MREVRGRRRPAQIAKWRGAILAAVTGTVLAGLRRFVLRPL